MGNREMKGRLLVIALLCPALAGCQAFGGLLVNIGLIPARKVAASYEFGPGPLLILIDDDKEVVTWGPATDLIVDEVAKHLKEADVETEIIGSRRLSGIRREIPAAPR